MVRAAQTSRTGIDIDLKELPNNKRGLLDTIPSVQLDSTTFPNAKATGLMDNELKSQLIKRKLEATYSNPYDAKFCIAVVGSEYSGKEDILNKELYSEAAIMGEQPHPSKIKIFTKRYLIKDKWIHVEFWSCPEDPSWMKYCSRLVSGLAGTIMFFDVTLPYSLNWIKSWIDEFHSLGDSFGLSKTLIGNKIDVPGRRKVFQEDAEAFADENSLGYFETSPSDEIDAINDIFFTIVSDIAEKIPDDFDRGTIKTDVRAKYDCPVGLQLDLALSPAVKFKYKQKLKQTQPLGEGTTSADWLLALE